MPILNTSGVVGTDGSEKKPMVAVSNMKKTDRYPAVYQIHNPITGEYYIGATSNIGKRIKDHMLSLRRGDYENYKLQNSVKSSNILEVAVFQVETVEQAFELEAIHINENKGNPLFLNIKDVAPPPMLGRHHSDETKEKIRQHHKAMYESGYINPFLGKKHSNEYKERHSKMTQNLWLDDNFRNNQIEKRREIMSDPDIRKNISDKVKELWKDPDYRAHQLAKRREQFSSSSYRELLSKKAKERMKEPNARKISSEAAKKQWEDSDYREKKCEAAKEQWKNPEYKNNHIQKLRKYYEDPLARAKIAECTKEQWKNPEYRAKICKKVTINNITYNSLVEAASSLNLSKCGLRSFMKKNNILPENKDA